MATTEEEYEYVEYGEIGRYDILDHRDNSPYDKPSWRWIWSGPLKRFTRSSTNRGFFRGEPYIFQHVIEDYETVYVRRKKSSN